MGVFMKLSEYLMQDGGGFVSSYIAADVLLLFIAVLSFYCIPSIYRLQRNINILDRISGFHLKSHRHSSIHWLKGHTVQYENNHSGMMKGIARTKDFPAIFNFHIAPGLTMLHLYHPDTIQGVLSSTIPKDPIIYGFLDPWIGTGLLSANGSFWQKHRHLLTTAFHFNILKSYIATFNECANVMLDKLDSMNGEAVNVFEHVSLLTLDTMMQCTMSTKSGCQTTEGGHPYIKAVQEMSSIVITRSNSVVMLFDWLFNILPIGRRFRKAADYVHDYTKKIIENRRKELETISSDNSANNVVEDQLNYQSKKQSSFLDILIQAKDENGAGLSDKEIQDEVDTFLFEGHDTTSSGISWALYNLAKHPEHQEKCRKEIESVVGSKPNVEWGDLSKLEYLTMCIKESMRLYPPVWVIVRQNQEDLPIKSHFNNTGALVPKGTTILIHIFTLHRNHALWENPHDFIPERFTKENISKRPPHAFIPFSAGTRNCIGQNFAMNEVKVVLCQTLRRFALKLEDPEKDCEMALHLILASKNAMRIKFEPLKQP